MSDSGSVFEMRPGADDDQQKWASRTDPNDNKQALRGFNAVRVRLSEHRTPCGFCYAFKIHGASPYTPTRPPIRMRQDQVRVVLVNIIESFQEYPGTAGIRTCQSNLSGAASMTRIIR